MIVDEYSSRWNGKQITGVLSRVAGESRDNWAMIRKNGILYLIARDEEDVWWLIPNDNDYPDEVLGPYTYDYVVALARVLS
jgi:hypothetical protein